MEIPLELETTFRPEVGKEIYEGIIDFEVSAPSGPNWDAFRQEVIDEFQEPKFDDWPHIGPDASIEVVSSWAGKSNMCEICVNVGQQYVHCKVTQHSKSKQNM